MNFAENLRGYIKIDEAVFEKYAKEYFGEDAPHMDFVKSYKAGNLLSNFRKLRK